MSADDRVQELTEKLRAAEAGEAKFRILAQKAKDAILATDRNGAIDYVNRGGERLFGYSSAELVGQPITIVLPRKVIEQPHSPGTVRVETVGRKKDGTEFPVDVSVSTWTTPEGTFSSSIVRDVTARLAAERALRQSEANFRALIEHLPHSVIVHRDGSVIYVNPALLALLGYRSHREVVGKPIAHLAPEPAPGAARPGGSPHERLRRKDGTHASVESVSMPMQFDGGPATVVLAQDVAAQRALQAQVILADRMMSIGTLAAGVAHEINNPLSFVLSNVVFVREELSRLAGHLPGTAEMVSALRDAEQGAERVASMVRDLKMLSRASDDAPVAIAVEPAVEAAVHVAESAILRRARVVRDYGQTRPVRATESRLCQVLLNLLLNAAQAIPEGSVDRHEVRVSTRAEPGRVIIAVRDTGEGISPENLGRIFEPFFTTKPVGLGTGLGLSISHDIVRGFGGEIVVRSVVGQGTTFEVVLPDADSVDAARRGDTLRPPPSSTGAR